MITLLHEDFPYDPKGGCSETPMNRGFQTPCKGYRHGSCKGYVKGSCMGYLDGSCMGYSFPSLYPLEKPAWMVDFVNNYNQKGKCVLTDACLSLTDVLKPA